MTDSYVVTGAAAYATRTSGEAVLLYKGALLPEDTTLECLERLLGGDDPDSALVAKVPSSFEPGGLPVDIPDMPVVPASKAQAKPGGKPAGA